MAIKITNVDGVAVTLELGTDWKGRDTYFATVNGVRRSFWSEWAAGVWVSHAVQLVKSSLPQHAA